MVLSELNVRGFSNGRADKDVKTITKPEPIPAPTPVEVVVPQLSEIVAGERVCIGLTTCPQCDVLKAFMDENKLPYRFVKWDKGDTTYAGLRVQLVEAMNGVDKFTYPQIFENGTHVDR